LGNTIRRNMEVHGARRRRGRMGRGRRRRRPGTARRRPRPMGRSARSFRGLGLGRVDERATRRCEHPTNEKCAKSIHGARPDARRSPAIHPVTTKSGSSNQ
jgi:hypothetical protein